MGVGGGGRHHSAPLSVGDATLGNGAAFVTALGGGATMAMILRGGVDNIYGGDALGGLS